MRKYILDLLIFFIQCSITFVALLFIYMVFVLLDYQGGIEGFIGTTFLQPILGGILSIVTIGFCIFIGLPIRLIKSINIWLGNHFWISLLGMLIGMLLLIASLLPQFSEPVKAVIENEEVLKETPNLLLALLGWLLIAFSMLHLFPTSKVRTYGEQTLIKFIKT